MLKKRSFRYENDDEKNDKRNDRFLKEIILKTTVFKKLVVLLMVVNDKPSLTIFNNDPSLTIVNDYPSLTIVNEERRREETDHGMYI